VDSNVQAGSFVGRNREDVRQFNLSIVLRMLHFAGTVSRSQLTSASGLNRSTISALVNELEDLGLVTESMGESSSGAGRPSLMVSAAEDVVAFSVNPDVDATTVGVVTLGGRVITKRRFPTRLQPTAQEAAEIAGRLINELREELAPNTKIAGVGAAVPGQVRLNWVEQPFGAMIGQLTGLPVFLDNDATLGCMAERNFGMGRGFDDVVYLFSGSGGIGGGAIVNGQQLRGASGYAGELGHVRISDSTSSDYSGLTGTLESLVRRDDLLEVFKLDSATDEELENEILAVKEARTSQAGKLLSLQVEALALGLASFVNIFNPEVVIVAGFLGAVFDFDQHRFLEVLKANSLAASNERVIVRRSGLGSDLLMIGAAELPFRSLLARPSEFEFVRAKAKR
jgi:predicted NBD/HSP70 family sugar kinase